MNTSCEKSEIRVPTPDGNTQLIQQFRSWELRETSRDELHGCRSAACSASVTRKRGIAESNERGSVHEDMGGILNKVEAILFPNSQGQQVLMRSNMAYVPCPTMATSPELQDRSIDVHISQTSRSGAWRSATSSPDLDSDQHGIIRKCRSPSSTVKWKQLKERDIRKWSKSQSCCEEIVKVVRECEETRSLKVMRRFGSTKALSSSLPLHDNESVTSNEEGEDMPSHRRWAKIPQIVASSTIQTCIERSVRTPESSFLETGSSTTHVESEEDVMFEDCEDTSGVSARVIPKTRTGRLSRRSKFIKRIPQGDANRAITDLDSASDTDQSRDERESPSRFLYHENQDAHGQQSEEQAKCSPITTTDSAMIVSPSLNLHHGQLNSAFRENKSPGPDHDAGPPNSTHTLMLPPTSCIANEVETRYDQQQQQQLISIAEACEEEIEDGRNHQMSPPHTKKPLHFQSSRQASSGCQRRLLFSLKEDSTFSESSADDKHVDVQSCVHAQEDLGGEAQNDDVVVNCDTNILQRAENEYAQSMPREGGTF